MWGEGIVQGRKPKERNSYVLRMEDGTLVEVNQEIYQEWYRSWRRERYQGEKNQKYGVQSLNELEENGGDSGMPCCVQNGVEEIVLRNICQDKVREALEKLPDSDARLIELLYFYDVTVTDAATLYGCSRRAIQKRRKRILGALYQIMQNLGIQGGYF